MLRISYIFRFLRCLGFIGLALLLLDSCKTEPSSNSSSSIVKAPELPAKDEISDSTAATAVMSTGSEKTEKLKTKNLDSLSALSAEKPERSLDEPKKSDKTESKKQKRKKLKSKIEFEQLSYDFGEINQGDTVDYSFRFLNTGKGPLVIQNAEASCGCTRPSFPFVAVEAGSEGFIGVQYISVGKEGSQEPIIKVFTNASKEPIVLKLSGVVVVSDKEEQDTLSPISLTQDTIQK